MVKCSCACRLKSKLDFVELWGNQDTSSIIRELVPTLFGLMYTLKKADVGAHLERYLRAMKAIVKVRLPDFKKTPTNFGIGI